MKCFFRISILSLVLWIAGCKKDAEIVPPDNTASATNYSPVIPAGWPQPVYNFTSNPVTYDGFTLGRYLFYEPMLSQDTSISCGNCHQQIYAFANGPDHPVSHGVHDLMGKRNAPALFNLNWHNLLMWDGGVNNLEVQPLAPISNPLEFNMSINSVVNRLANVAKYKTLFKNAFGDTIVNSQRILKSFAQFMGLMVSYNSKYDKVQRHEDNFSASENNGLIVYQNKCAYCHSGPLFSDFTFRNKGLALNAYQDSGRYRITANPLDMFKFKVPSLRNLSFTAPYMHDGRYATLDDVLSFFVSGVVSTPNLDPYMAVPHSITAQEKSDLLSFLNTLNDYTFVSDPRFKEIH